MSDLPASIAPESAPHANSAVQSPLRLLHVVPTYFPAVRYGGPIRSVHALCASLARRGHRVTVYTTNVDGERNSDVPVGRPVDLDGVEVHYFAVPTLRRLYWSPALGRKLRSNVAEFDLVHLHSVFLWPTYAAARAASRSGVPYLIAPRGMLVDDLIRAKSRWIKNLWIRLIEQKSLEHAAGLHVTTELEEHEIRALRLPVNGTFCVPNGVSWPARHTCIAEGPARHAPKPYALFLSRINWKKGLDRLIAAWRFTPGELTLLIVGNDDEGITPKLKALAAREGVAHRVTFLGSVSDEHKWAIYENAEMFILPSRSENFGNVVAEAMAMACPVIVTPEVGIGPLVSRAGAGVVTSAEPETLARVVAELHHNELLRRRMGLAGRQAAIETLSWEGVASQMEAAYRAVLSELHS